MPKPVKQILFSLNPERRLSGGVRKMLDYLGHAQSFEDFRALVHFPPHLLKAGVENIYLRHMDSSLLVDDISTLLPDLVFSFITHKPYLRSQGAWRDEVPIMRLQQGFRGMDPARPSYHRQSDRIITISVGHGIGRAFRALCPHSINRVIPNAVDAEQITRLTAGVRKEEVLTIFGYKNPRMAERIRRRIAGTASVPVRLLPHFMDRPLYLRALAESAFALLIPGRVEGFYLPVLEAFATGTLVVCPDARGNRDTLRDGFNGVMPAYDEENIAAGVMRLLSAGEAEQHRWLRNGQLTLNAHAPEIERAEFRRLVDECATLWHRKA
ncbi:MAG: glycosyltransferase [Gammaproteobacteria bacterium]|nr:glycosyltransferase [Gammaproteobacteria bacterium]MYF31639.1 glycosyltransferase [Gammaproteobacteria bacterium]